MELFLTYLIKDIIFPPGIIFIGILVGLLISKRSPKTSRTLLWTSLLTGYLLSTPLVAGLLHQGLTFYSAIKPEELQKQGAQAIVILSSGRDRNSMEYGDDVVGRETLLRVRYGAFIHHNTSLPIIVSGGRVFDDEGKSLAQVMCDSLVNDFSITDVYMEDKSRTTGENALYSKALLDELGFKKIFLVTSNYHMARSVRSFEKLGVDVVPAPTALLGSGGQWLFNIFPSADSLALSRQALHEWVGMLWYMLRY